jgi:hypothetical protein
MKKENIKKYNIEKMKSANKKLREDVNKIFKKHGMTKSEMSILHNKIRGIGMLEMRLKKYKEKYI